MLERTSPVLPVSLIIVSDYLTADGDAELRRSLRAYAQDTHGVPAEIVIMLPSGPASESGPTSKNEHASAIEAELAGKAYLCPSVIVATHDSDESSQLKDAALSYCRHDLVAVVEADCLPGPGWLAALNETVEKNPKLDAVSGRTSYGEESMMKRVMSLLDRGFIERRNRLGQIIHASNNGALYRRSVLEQYRFEADHGPFISSHLRQHAMLRDGVAMELAAQAVSIHAYEGLGFIWDVRRNKGYQFARMLLRRKRRFSRLGLAVRAVATSFKENRQTAQAVGNEFCRWTDWPLFWAMMLLVRIPEFAGALAAGDPAAFKASTHYR
ncbi:MULTISPECIES: glycosyltransferase [unclassified Mesorhizobium]|uniref:glycosyltransferase n=1 Tax=unclassified Mesorhizobium TaxID=325217 RepID=UPI001FE02B7B|nr:MULTISPECIES: glycosyltransferase [unclassified Mesorhizobium]